MTSATLGTAILMLGGAVLAGALACDRRGGAVGDASTTGAPAPAPAPAEAEDRAAVEPSPRASGIAEPPLPDWVPDSGRLTIVGARDRDRNLGIVEPPARGDAGVREGVPPIAP